MNTSEWQKNNKEKQREYVKKSREKHKEKNRQYDRDRYAAKKARWQQYYIDNKKERLDKCAAYKKTENGKKSARISMSKRLQDPTIRLIHNMRSRVKNAMKNGGYKKSDTTKKLLGCTPEELRLHFESQFRDGMNWNNYGQWHVDHIKPVSSFDMTNSEHQRLCFHYTNLQPLWAMENFLKSDNL